MNVVVSQLARTSTWRARVIGAIGPLTVAAGVGWAAVRDWLAEVEHYAEATLARVARILRPAAPPRRARPADDRAPRHLFGLSFESRPPPLPA